MYEVLIHNRTQVCTDNSQKGPLTNWLKETILQEVGWTKLFYKRLAQRNYFGSSELEEKILHEGGLKKWAHLLVEVVVTHMAVATAP